MGLIGTEAVALWVAALYHAVVPGVMIVSVILYILVGLENRVNLTTPSAFHHFSRGYEGIVFSSIPVFNLFYWVTWFSEGMDAYARWRSELMIIYAELLS